MVDTTSNETKGSKSMTCVNDRVCASNIMQITWLPVNLQTLTYRPIQNTCHGLGKAIY